MKYTMRNDNDDSPQKVIRFPGETLLIKLSEDEINYRKKYLPDPTSLSHDKLLCTVCSKKLAQDVHRGRDIYVHRALQVLLCKECYLFYGDGSFSTEEDGDDKYCRWCGQGGILYQCSTCTCAFCHKCLKKNMKPSALTDLEKDDWRCYVCVPRPMFGCRTICWAAKELNKIGKEEKNRKLKAQQAKLKQLSDKKKNKIPKERRSKDDNSTRKRKLKSDDSDSFSTVFTPSKKLKHKTNYKSSKCTKDLILRKEEQFSENDMSEDEKYLKQTKSIQKIYATSTSEEESRSIIEKTLKLKKKNRNHENSKECTDSDDLHSTEQSDHSSLNTTNLRKSYKSKQISRDKTQSSSSSSTSDISSFNSYKKQIKTRRKEENTNLTMELKKNESRALSVNNTNLIENEQEHESSNVNTEPLISTNIVEMETIEHLNTESNTGVSEEQSEFGEEMSSLKLSEETTLDGNQVEGNELPELELKGESEQLSSSLEPKSNEKSKTLSQENNDCEIGVSKTSDLEDFEGTNIEENIKLAVEWLSGIGSDISDLGNTISVRTTTLKEKEINIENLNSYEDVLVTLTKLKQLISNIHSNFKLIDESLDGKLRPWKILTGLEQPENDHLQEEISQLDRSEGETSQINDMLEHGEIESEDVSDKVSECRQTLNNNVNSCHKSDYNLENNVLLPEDSTTIEEGDIEQENTHVTEEIKVDSKIKDGPNRTNISNENRELEDIKTRDSGETFKLVDERESVNVEEINLTSSEHFVNESVANVVSKPKDVINKLVEDDGSYNLKENVDCVDKNESDKFKQGNKEIVGAVTTLKGESTIENHYHSLNEKYEGSCDSSTVENSKTLSHTEADDASKKIHERENTNGNNFCSPEEENGEENCDSSTVKPAKILPHILADDPSEEIHERENTIENHFHSSSEGKGVENYDSSTVETSKILPHIMADDASEEVHQRENTNENQFSSFSEGKDEENCDSSKFEKSKVLSHVMTDNANEEIQEKSSDNKESEETGLNKDNDHDVDEAEEESPSKEDAENYEALQLMLFSSSEDESRSSESSSSQIDSDESEDMLLEDSDLEIKMPSRTNSKKISKTKKKKIEIQQNNLEDKENTPKQQVKKVEEELDSEAEIDLLTDIKNLKKRTFSRRLLSRESSEDDSEDEMSAEDRDVNTKGNSRRGKKYNNETKKRREEERNELLGFLERDSSSEAELDITKDDLDDIESQYGSCSTDSMSLQAFSNKMNAKWKELEKEQEEMNLQLLLASESEEGSVGEDDIILDPNYMKKKNKVSNKKAIKENTSGDENKNKKLDEEDEIEEKMDVDIVENENNTDIKTEPDEKYVQFLEGMVKNRPSFKGLGSSSEENDQDSDATDIKEEPQSDGAKTEMEPNDSKEYKGIESSETVSSESASSGDLFIGKDKTTKKSWRSHKLLKIKLSDTDTSDEERWWQMRLEREKKKKQEGDNSDSSGFDGFTRGLIRPNEAKPTEKKINNSSEKENKKETKQEEETSSSAMELSSTDSSGSSTFWRKKKKKKNLSDSDVIAISDTDKKKKKKKKRGVSGASSDESGGSGDNVMNISQKSTLGESPGKGGRKNIRKVLTKHELAAATKAAAKEEEERKKRIAARQKLFNEMFEIKEAETLEKLVLDFDPETKTELIAVDRDLVVKMKPHQAKGVKFMWDSCFESLSQLKTKKGSGCILAHCMGLGKTFQVISLVHTILKHKDTNVKTVLVVCPLSTVLNWYSEFGKWLDDVRGGRDIKVYHLTKFKRPHERARHLSLWHEKGGVLVIGYEMFRILTNETSKKFRLVHRNIFQETLIDPGADLVVCDEGHMLKNESTLLSKAMSRIKTLRRIVLTGTPMQNNLKEYHCMVQFVKPNLLGTRKEFLNQFVNPITNGQFVDSTESDVKVMKRRAHVLHKMLEGLVQRYDYSVLTPFLPPKHEYVVSLRLSQVQVKLYQYYLDHFSQKAGGSGQKVSGSQLFADWQALGRIWTHPLVVKMSTDKAEREKRRLGESEEEGSIKDLIDDKSSGLSLSSSRSSTSSDDDDDGNKFKKQKLAGSKKEKEKNIEEKSTVPSVIIETEINLISSEEDENSKELQNEKEKSVGEGLNRKEETAIINNDANEKQLNSSGDTEDTENKINQEFGDENVVEDISKFGDKNNISNSTEDTQDEKTEENAKESKRKEIDSKGAWWKHIIRPEHLEDINQSAKLILLFAILRESEMIEDKVLVFSQSLFSLDLIEHFLEKVDKATEENRLEESLGNHTGCWTKGLDYFRLDGSSSSENRSAWCKSFNRDDNPRARLFLISTRAGGLGINLTAANRVIIFDASWNPSHDVQSIFRIYRFGQKKPCYVYRFIVHGTMEEKVYDRQVAKQSLSSRVVDEQQVHRHFSMNDLNELYVFTPPVTKDERPTPALPKDRLMAELLTQYNNWIEKYHEHDSLLENILEEELNEEERKLAWEDFENDKQRGVLPSTSGYNHFPHAGITTNNQQELFRKSLRLKYPNSTEQEMNAMLQTLMNQVNNLALQNAQKIVIGQMPSQVPSTSQQSTQNFRTMPSTSTLTQQQMFQHQKTNFYNKFKQPHFQSLPQPIGQIMGNSQIKQNQRANNYQVNFGTGNYADQMRKQQEANLARVKNQGKLQESVLPTKLLKNIYQLPSPSVQQRQPPIQNRQQGKSIQQQRTANPVQIPNQLVVNKQQQNRVNNRQMQMTSATRPVQPIKRTPLQLQQEQMRQRINALQQQKQRTLQQKLKQSTQGNAASVADANKRKLEEMKNRYKATRRNPMSSSTPSVIVEIDDEPTRPSDSAT